jgi:hypothetical protein
MALPGGKDAGIERCHPGVEQALLLRYCAELEPGAAVEQALLLHYCTELEPGAAVEQALSLRYCAELEPGAAIEQALNERRKLLMPWVFQARSLPEHELVMLCCR